MTAGVIHSETLGYPSVYKKFRILGILGCIFGDFPVKNAMTSKVSNRLSFKTVSFYVILSLGVLLLRITFLYDIISSLSALFAADYGIYTGTDLIALGTMIFTTLGFGIIAQLLNLSRTRGFLQILQVLDLYNDKYTPKSVTRLFTKRLMVCILSSCLISLFPALILTQETPTEAFKQLLHSKSLGFSRLNIEVILRVILGMPIVEYGSLFYYAVLFYTSKLYTDRFNEILEILREKSAKNSPFGSRSYQSTDAALEKREKLELFQKSVLDITRQKSWKALSEQYLDFCDIYELFQDFVGQYFIVLFLTLIISLICMVYVVSNIKSMLVSDTAPILVGVTCFSFVRILFLCNVGEEFEITQKRIVKTLGRLQEGTFWPDEEKEFHRFVDLVKTMPIRLSANGFFVVNRTKVTSILSVIITYFIVLIQFKMSSAYSVFNNHTSTEVQT